MKVVGSALLGVDRDRVWDALQDPAVLVRTIPGCERLESMGGDAYKMTVSAGVASIKGVYQGEVELSEPEQPERFVLRARGQGAPGTVEATVLVRLSAVDGGTRIDYDAEAVVGGMIGGVGQRMLSSVAKKTAGEFFTAVENHLASGGLPEPASGESGTAVPALASVSGGAAVSGASAVSGGAAVRSAAGEVFERPAAGGGKAGRTAVPPWSLYAAFGMGAGVALAGAAIGWLFGRSGRRG